MSETPEWDGEGLPPAGLVCEAKRYNGDWEEVEVLKHGDKLNGYHEAACMCKKSGKLIWAKEFRRKPNTYHIEGDISQAAVRMLKTVGGEYAEEILSLVKEEN